MTSCILSRFFFAFKPRTASPYEIFYRHSSCFSSGFIKRYLWSSLKFLKGNVFDGELPLSFLRLSGSSKFTPLKISLGSIWRMIPFVTSFSYCFICSLWAVAYFFNSVTKVSFSSENLSNNFCKFWLIILALLSRVFKAASLVYTFSLSFTNLPFKSLWFFRIKFVCSYLRVSSLWFATSWSCYYFSSN